MSDTAAASRHVAVHVAAAPAAVYAIASDPARLPEWAAGLARTPLEQVDGVWCADAPFGRVQVRFSPPNGYGVLDHVVTMPSGEEVLNPMRVLPHGGGSEVVFTVRQREGVSDDEFEADVRAVTADLATLRDLVERG